MKSNKTKYKENYRTIGFSYHDEELFHVALSIRQSVFVKEQQIDQELEFDGYDKDAQHFLLYVNSTAVATARWRETKGGIKLERFAVLKQYRNLGLGRKLMDYIMQNKPVGKELYFYSQLSAVGFYETMGFEKNGELFYEAGIPHYSMKQVNKQQNS